jgi:hypothetical protein
LAYSWIRVIAQASALLAAFARIPEIVLYIAISYLLEHVLSRVEAGVVAEPLHQRIRR